MRRSGGGVVCESLTAGAVSAHVDGVHDGEGTADAEEEAEEAADGGGP